MNSPFRRRTTPEQLNDWATDTAVSHLGITVIELGDDYLRATMPVDSRTRQSYGLLHGHCTWAASCWFGKSGSRMRTPG